MKPIEIIECVEQEDPTLLGKLPKIRAAQIVRAALSEIGKQIDAMDEGVLKVPGFGIFRVRHVEREKDGQKVTVKRVIFVATKRKPEVEED